MAFVSIREFHGETQASVFGRTPSTKCSMAVHKTTRSNSGKQAYALSFSISEEVMKQARWLIGDRVNVFFDDQDQTLVLLSRVQNGGYMLSNQLGEKAVGMIKRATIKINLPEKLPFKYGDVFAVENTHLNGDGLVIKFKQIKKGQE